MDSFSISQLEQFSGVKAHTIRVWEQRYGALQPNRSEGNTRYYNNNQLRRLLNIVSLMEGDHKVSELCCMSDNEIFSLIDSRLQNTSNSENAYQYHIGQLIAAGMNYDEAHFEKIFLNSLLRLGIKDTYIQVIYPMLARIGLMWTKNSIPAAQEHFITNIIKQKLFTATDELPPAKSSKDSWILYLPENEFHEIGLLMSHYLIKLSGKKSIYLGANLPFDSIINTVKETSSKNILFFLIHNDTAKNAQKYIDNLSGCLNNINIYLSGNHSLIQQIALPKKTYWITSVEDLEEQLK